MRATIIFAVLLMTVSLLSSCKKPRAEFQLKRINYSAGDMLDYENYSSNQYTCTWQVLNDKNDVLSEYEGNYPVIRLSVLIPDGLYSLRLIALNKNENKSDLSESKQFLVSTERRSMTINQGGAGHSGQKSYDVFVDGELIGQGKPSSVNSMNGRFQANIPMGVRHIRLVSATKNKQEVVNVTQSFSIFF